MVMIFFFYTGNQYYMYFIDILGSLFVLSIKFVLAMFHCILKEKSVLLYLLSCQ